MSHNEHQDWNTIVIHGSEARGSGARAAATTARPARSAAAAAAIRAENDEKPRVRYLSADSIAALQVYRRTHSKSQADLDKDCSFSTGTMNKIEGRKAAPTSYHLSTLSRIVGATLTLEKV